SALFTSVLAPLLVSILTEKIKNFSASPAGRSRRAEEKPAVTLLAPETTEPTRWAVCGSGRTPEEADRDAVRNALWSAIVPTTVPSRLTSDGRVLLEAALRRSAELVVRSEEVARRAERQGRTTLVVKEVVVEVDGRRLRECLRAASGRGEGESSSVRPAQETQTLAGGRGGPPARCW